MPTSKKTKTSKTTSRATCSIPPGLQAVKQDTSIQFGAKKYYEHTPASGEVVVVMRYKREMDRRIRNCLIRMKGRIRQYGPGVCLGVTDKVHVLDVAFASDWGARSDWCIAMFMFPNETQATRWYNSEPELKQHDFLPPSDCIQLFALHLRYIPQSGPLTFNWEELHNIRSNSYLQKEYVDKTAELYDEHAINHGVIFVQDPSSKEEVNRFKDSWIRYNSNAYCIVNLFDSEEQFYSVYNSDKYRELRAKRAEMCETVSLLFTIDPDITGPPSIANK